MGGRGREWWWQVRRGWPLQTPIHMAKKKKKSNQLKNHQSNQETASPPGRKRGRNQNSKWGFQGEGWVGRDRRGERGENSNSEVIWLKR